MIIKKEIGKEIGKFFVDLAKLVIAIAIIAPLVQGSISVLDIKAVIISCGLGLLRIYNINRGVKDE
mgnify:CR=1 FL=1